jgi:hypothetical protein
MLAGTAIMLVGVASLADRRLGIRFADQVRALRSVALACAAAWPPAWAVAHAGPESPWPALLSSALVGVVVYLVCLRFAEPGLLGESGRQIARAFARKPEAPAPS